MATASLRYVPPLIFTVIPPPPAKEAGFLVAKMKSAGSVFITLPSGVITASFTPIALPTELTVFEITLPIALIGAATIACALFQASIMASILVCIKSATLLIVSLIAFQPLAHAFSKVAKPAGSVTEIQVHASFKASTKILIISITNVKKPPNAINEPINMAIAPIMVAPKKIANHFNTGISIGANISHNDLNLSQRTWSTTLKKLIAG